MKHLLDDVAKMHKAFGHPCRGAPVDEEDFDHDEDLQKRHMMRLRLVTEEFFELLGATLGSDIIPYKEEMEPILANFPGSLVDMQETADALGDLVVVIVGMALELGIPLDRVWSEIMRANMSKVSSDGRVTYRTDGKVLKPPGWTPPNIGAALNTRTEASWHPYNRAHEELCKGSEDMPAPPVDSD